MVQSESENSIKNDEKHTTRIPSDPTPRRFQLHTAVSLGLCSLTEDNLDSSSVESIDYVQRFPPNVLSIHDEIFQKAVILVTTRKQLVSTVILQNSWVRLGILSKS